MAGTKLLASHGFSLTLLIHNRLLKYKRTFIRWLFGAGLGVPAGSL